MFVALISMLALLLIKIPVSAATDPITVINNLSDFVFSMIRSVGIILLGWGIVQVGLSLQSHDPSQRSNGFLTLAGGIIITFAEEILKMITG
ncbi:MAG: glutamyl-tRNA amidotransferase [Eubacteriaceae bacterium]|nr:glutamyl-tRNA amidotransferase [Eubacteriaceae bacterium]